MKEPIPQLPRRRLNAEMRFRRKPRRIIPIAKKLQPKLTRQSRNKILIRIRLRPAQLVIEVNNRKDNPQLAPQLQQQPQQRDRINPAGDCYADAIPGPQQLLPLNVRKRALGEGMHGNMVLSETKKKAGLTNFTLE